MKHAAGAVVSGVEILGIRGLLEWWSHDEKRWTGVPNCIEMEGVKPIKSEGGKVEAKDKVRGLP